MTFDSESIKLPLEAQVLEPVITRKAIRTSKEYTEKTSEGEIIADIQ